MHTAQCISSAVQTHASGPCRAPSRHGDSTVYMLFCQWAFADFRSHYSVHVFCWHKVHTRGQPIHLTRFPSSGRLLRADFIRGDKPCSLSHPMHRNCSTHRGPGHSPSTPPLEKHGCQNSIHLHRSGRPLCHAACCRRHMRTCKGCEGTLCTTVHGCLWLWQELLGL